VSIGELSGQGWLQLSELGLAFVLAALIGLEREIRQKSAGLRTYTLVGFASALIVLVSKYGFGDVLSTNLVVLDPSRVAAQVVSGIGFIGAGLIFVRRGSVRGLTTAAVVWLTAAVGMACGAGLPILALAVTAGHFIIVLGFPYIAARLPKSKWTPSLLHITYADAPEVLRDILITCMDLDFDVGRLQVERSTDSAVRAVGDGDAAPQLANAQRIVTVNLEVQGIGSISKLAAKLAGVKGVVSVNAGDVNVLTE
jgi:putative Mg2+ transporter-C (MgtC) family protein